MTPREKALARVTAPGQRFEIHQELVRGVPMQVFANRERNLSELLEASRAFSDTEYLAYAGGRITYAEHYEAVAALATALRTEYDVQPGDRVALCGANSAEWILAFWAAVTLGAVAVGMNSMWVAEEFRHGVDLTEPKVLFVDTPRAPMAQGMTTSVLRLETDLAELIERHRGATMPAAAMEEDDPAVILFTSGTSGRSKGSTHSHRNVLCAVWFHLLNDALATEMGSALSGRRYLLLTPLFHIAGLHNLAEVGS